MATRIELPKFQAFDDNGDPLSGGLVYTYEVGTTTLKTTYTDRDAGTPNANPVVLDSRGEADIYGSGSYKIVLKTSAGVTVWTLDNIRGINEVNLTTIDDYDGDFDSAITDIGATETTLYIDSTATMSGVVSVPTTCIVVLEKGGDIDQGGNALTFLSAPVFNGGTITNDAALTFGVPFDCPKYEALSATTGVVYTYPQVVYPEFYGAVGDGSTDDSTPIQAAIDDLETAKGGTVQFLSKTYVCNIEAKSYVELKGACPMFKGSSTGTKSHSNTYLKASGTGYIITTAATAVHGITVRNLGFIGLGSGTALKGIYLQDVSRSLFEELVFDNIADEAIRINDGNPNHFRRIFAQNCLLDTSQAAKIGVLHIESGADDQWVSECEFTPSLAALTDANKYVCAVVVDSANNFFYGVVAAYGDAGFHITSNGDQNRFFSCRADLNFGHGFEIAGGGSNQFFGCFSYRNGQETDDTYDGFNSASCSGNIFVGCNVESVSGDAAKHRYGFYDDQNSSTVRSSYNGCQSYLHQTAKYSGNQNYGISPSDSDVGLVLPTADDATPSVGGLHFLDLGYYTGATDVTDFDDGVNGQEINIYDNSANGFITIKHSATIITTTGADLVMKQNVIYTFKNTYGAWIQVAPQQFSTDTTAAGAGADGTISSRSAGALGECDGFVKMYNSAGTLVYVPYWLDITP